MCPHVHLSQSGSLAGVTPCNKDSAKEAYRKIADYMSARVMRLALKDLGMLLLLVKGFGN